MDYATALCGWVTMGSHSTSLLYEYDYLPRPHKVIRPSYTCEQTCNRPAKLCLPSQYTPLHLGSGLCFFLTLSSLLAVEDDKRIRNRSPRNTESQKIVKFYCCGNHQTQSPTITQQANLLGRYLVGISQENSTRSLFLIRVYIYKVLMVRASNN